MMGGWLLLRCLQVRHAPIQVSITSRRVGKRSSSGQVSYSDLEEM